MRRSSRLLGMLALFSLVLGLTACGSSENSAAVPASLTLRTYAVPAARAENLSRTLNHVLVISNGKTDVVGRAWVAGPGQLLVLAPAQMQGSIADSIKQIVASDKNAGVLQPLRLNAWVVDTYPGSGPADPSLKAIQSALQQFSASMGPVHFTRERYFTAVSDLGPTTVLAPAPGYRLSFSIAAAENAFTLQFSYTQPSVNRSAGASHMQGQVTIPMGQTTVLGLISDRPVKSAGAGAGLTADMSPVLLVVRITPANRT